MTQPGLYNYFVLDGMNNTSVSSANFALGKPLHVCRYFFPCEMDPKEAANVAM